MANFVVNKCMNLIKTSKPELSSTDLEVIQYGLHGLYLSLTKVVVLIVASYILGQLREFIFFILVFTILRTNSYGLHTSKSWVCWVTTIPIFIIFPRIALITTIPIYIKVILGGSACLYIFKYSPADTKKRPIINKKIRKRHKILATITAIIFVIISIISQNNFISNVFFLCLLLICFSISPQTYKLFKMPYNNYLNYMS